MTIDEAKALSYGQWLHHKTQTQGGNVPLRIRVNGRPQVWKTRPDEVRVPVRWGMRSRDQFSLYEYDLPNWHLGETCAACESYHEALALLGRS
jgi:hypothetical protein